MSTKIFCLLLIGLLLTAAGCKIQNAYTPGAALQDLIEGGMLKPFDPALLVVEQEVAAVEIRALTGTNRYLASPIYRNQRHLYFQATQRYLLALNVVRGQRVQKGDVLAELAPLESERLGIQLDNAVRDLARFERAFANDRNVRLRQIEEANYALLAAAEAEFHMLTLERARLEVNFERFLLDSERNRERLARIVEGIERQLEGEKLIAPFDGVILHVTPLQPGAMLASRLRIVTLAEEDSMFFSVIRPAIETWIPEYTLRALFRYGDILPLHLPNTTIEMDMHIVSDPWAAGQRREMRYLLNPADREAFLEMLDAYNIDLSMPNLPMFFVHVQWLYVADALTVPAAAVRTFDGRNYVLLYYHGGYYRRQYVVTGALCGETRQYIQIVSGLVEGQKVILP